MSKGGGATAMGWSEGVCLRILTRRTMLWSLGPVLAPGISLQRVAGIRTVNQTQVPMCECASAAHTSLGRAPSTPKQQTMQRVGAGNYISRIRLCEQFLCVACL